MSSSSNQAHAISTACFYCGSSTHEAIDCEFYVAAVGQEIINEQLYSVGKYNDKVFPSWLNLQPLYPYGKRDVESYPSVNTPAKPYQGGNHGYLGPSPFPNRAPNPMYSQGTSTSQAPQRKSYYQPPPGFEHNGGQQAQDMEEPSMREMLNALTRSQLKSDQKHDSLCDQVSMLNQGMRKLELEVGNISKQLQTRPQGALPSQTEQNSRHESAKAITLSIMIPMLIMMLSLHLLLS
ncbi:hypothetical protein M0R45_025932 [Rubus argutus]|uniref:Uncharacterized protein n=1 Tax=Rubus argutus TaxID=59490 RepID=A0AAW1WWR1_RUBAR